MWPTVQNTLYIMTIYWMCGCVCAHALIRTFMKQYCYHYVVRVLLCPIQFCAFPFLFYSHAGPLIGSWLTVWKTKWINSVCAPRWNEVKTVWKSIYTQRWNQEPFYMYRVVTNPHGRMTLLAESRRVLEGARLAHRQDRVQFWAPCLGAGPASLQ